MSVVSALGDNMMWVALMGSLVCWIFGNHFGRRVTLMAGALIILIGAALQAAAVNLAMLIVFRIFAGFGIGVLTSIAPPFVAECFPTRLRGFLVSCELLIGSSGLCTSFWVAYGSSFVTGQFAWRFPVALQCIFPIISISLLCFLPDSPRWYVEQGRIEEAREILVRLNGEKEGERVLQDIQDALVLEGGAQDGKSWLTCFKNNDQCFRYRTFLSIGSLFMQQFTGVNMISYYSAVLFQNSIGLSANLSLLLSGANGLNSLFWVAVSTLFLIDRVGRVRLMMFTAAIQAVEMAVLAAVLHYVDQSRTYGIVGASMLFLFFCTFSVGWLAPSWIYPSEITPLAIRASATALGSASNWIFNFVVVEITPAGIANIGPNYYIIYAITNALCVPMLYFLYPETANISLEEVDSLFADRKIFDAVNQAIPRLVHWLRDVFDEEMKPISDPWKTPMRGVGLVIAYTIACGVAFLLFGYDQGVMGGLVNSPYFLEVFPSLASNPSLLGTTVAIYEVGALIGSLVCSVVGDLYGRRLTLVVGAAIVFVGAALQAGSVHLAMFIVFRIVTGMGIGVLTSITPAFHAECVPTKLRGSIVSCQLVLCAVGLTSSFWVGYGSSYVPTQFAWRFPVALQCVFPIVTIVLLCFLPDSPRWYVEQGRIDDARDLLVRLNGPIEGENVLQDIQDALALEAQTTVKSWFDCFKDNEQCFRYRTLLSMGSLLMQQMTGVNMISYYSAVLFQNSVGLSANLSLLLSGFNGLNSLFWVSFSTLFLIDRVGRVRLMMWTAATQAAQMAVLAAVLHYVEESRNYGIVGASMLFFFYATFSAGWLAPSWLYPSEITPLAIRASAAALGSASNWVFNFVVVEITPSGITNIGPNYYIIYAITNAICVPMLYFLFPETANLSLEEVDSLFVGGKVHVRRSPWEKVAHAGPLTKRPVEGDLRIDNAEKQFAA
ncbi:general substrate transporter [Calocera viscosa TUFC12733]|uniref:General substrate transporter n=1 Tax=Calocera viscosa (strain TUFC12733) TaxID=1330018 RepID=A0A167HI98_CALVF|nr:general substrate transporter [Calocera viscosa TUFC12733]